MRKKIILLIAAVWPVLLLTGCWDFTEPEDIGLVSVLGINCTDQNRYEIIAEDESLIPGGQISSQKANWTFDIHKSSGTTISDAIQNNYRINAERMYLAHTKAIIVSEELVRQQGIRPVIDFLGRNAEIRQNSYFLVSKEGEFEKIFLPNAKYNKNTGEIIEKIIKEKDSNAFMMKSQLGNFLELYWGPYSTPYALGVGSSQTSMNDENVEQRYDNTDAGTFDIDVGDIAVFSKEKMAGWLNGDESRGLLWVTGDVKGGYINIEYEGKPVTIKILHVKSTKKPVVEDEKMKMSVRVNVEADIAESLADADFDDINIIKKIERILNQKITTEIYGAIHASEDMPADAFNFGKCFFETYPNYWRTAAARQADLYSELETDVKVNSVINHIGLEKKPAKNSSAAF